MMTGQNLIFVSSCATTALFMGLIAGCTRQPQKASSEGDSGKDGLQQVVLRKMPAGKQFSGFLTDYSNLKPNPDVEGSPLTYVKADERKNLHKYIGMIVDPVQVYVATDVDDSK